MEVPERTAVSQLADDAFDETVTGQLPSIGERGDELLLALDQARHRLVDRVGGQQVPARNRIALADPVTPQVPVKPLFASLMLELARETGPEPNSSSRPITRSCAISSSGWLSTGVPVSASRSPSGVTRCASRRTA